MKVYVESCLDCSPDKVWDEVQKSSLFIEVLYPITKIISISTEFFPERWIEGSTVVCQFTLLGLIPILGSHEMFFERIDQAQREIQTREKDILSRQWDHLIQVRESEAGRTLYSDSVEIDAGMLTLPVWLFANWFFRHRHSRWKMIAQQLDT
jgi:hypothetical protein